MNCFNHAETPAIAYCRTCGKALCAECKRTAQGTIFCDEHAPAEANAAANYARDLRQQIVDDAQAAALPRPAYGPASSATGDVSPGLACLLGFIPGVGAIYNGQYAKGLVHAIIFGLLVSIESSGSAGDLAPLFGILIGVWVMYMALEAYHTARKRRAGEPVDEFSSILDVRGRRGGFPVGAITLIALGILLLLSTTDVIQLRYLLRYWPILLIVAGAYMLYARLTSAGDPIGGPEVRHERQ
jgi:LiaI-LiaF-like transmembrane region/B-box zinc finger